MVQRLDRRFVRAGLVGAALAALLSSSGCTALTAGPVGMGASGVVSQDYRVTNADRNDGFPTALEAGL